VNRGRSILLCSAAAVPSLVGAAAGVVALRHRAAYGTVLDEMALTATVGSGHRFSLAVADAGASVGDSWSAAVAPDAPLTAVDNRVVMRSLLDRTLGPAAGGGAGTRYFVFRADRAGTARVTLSNCFQGCHRPSPYSRSLVWTITVT
jgi:inhibitor of cysteine peptidase